MPENVFRGPTVVLVVEAQGVHTTVLRAVAAAGAARAGGGHLSYVVSEHCCFASPLRELSMSPSIGLR